MTVPSVKNHFQSCRLIWTTPWASLLHVVELQASAPDHRPGEFLQRAHPSFCQHGCCCVHPVFPSMGAHRPLYGAAIRRGASGLNILQSSKNDKLLRLTCQPNSHQTDV
ncbi:hypothetical protein NQD34_005858 [Periophthalmus magnuspinnatus]|nr:hypothetical protein NQD34_005858 [Periophthalmus magnuspinnatus]